MAKKPDKRRAQRIAVNEEIVVEAIGQPKMMLHENLEKVYQRVIPATDKIGERFTCSLRDLSTNGAFIAGEPMPLLSRLAFKFELEGFGETEVIGWTLWRRDDDCELPRDDGTSARLPMGFGVLFEAIPLDARLAIHKLVAKARA